MPTHCTVRNTNLGIRYENVHDTKQLHNGILTSMCGKWVEPGTYIINSSIRVEAESPCTLLQMFHVNNVEDEVGF